MSVGITPEYAQKDLYGVFGLQEDAKPDAIKAAYRRLARKLHPDRNSDPGTQEKFKEVTEAYAILSDATTRNEYDRLRAEWLASGRQQAYSGTSSDPDMGGSAAATPGDQDVQGTTAGDWAAGFKQGLETAQAAQSSTLSQDAQKRGASGHRSLFSSFLHVAAAAVNQVKHFATFLVTSAALLTIMFAARYLRELRAARPGKIRKTLTPSPQSRGTGLRNHMPISSYALAGGAKRKELAMSAANLPPRRGLRLAA
jgi:DnaJ domain